MVFAEFNEFYCCKHLGDLAVASSPHAIPDANGLGTVWQACKNSLVQTSRIDHDEDLRAVRGAFDVRTPGLDELLVFDASSHR